MLCITLPRRRGSRPDGACYLLTKVMRYTKYGWPSTVHHQLKPFFNRKTELTIEGKYLMWGIRVVIPQKYQREILNELHKDHPGIYAA